MKRINLKGVSAQTWARTIVLLLALVNQALIMFGKTETEINVDSWVSYATYAFTAISSVWAWWKNNSFTNQAQTADKSINPAG